MKAKTVRLLAGGLAATIIMTNMATMPVFADDSVNTTAPYECEVMEDTAVEEAPETEEAETEAAEEAQDEEAQESVEETEAQEAETEAAEETQSVETTQESVEETEAQEAETEAAEEAQEAETEAAEEAQEAATEAAEEADAEIIDAEQLETADAKEAQTEEAQQTDKDADLLTEEEAEADEPLLGAAPEEAKEAAATAATSEKPILTVEEAEAEAKRIESEISDIGDVMKLLISKDSTKMIPELCKAADKAKAAKSVDAKDDPTEVIIYDIVRRAYSVALDKAFGYIPVVNCVSGPLKGLILKMFGFGEESIAKKPKTIEERIDETNTKIDEAKGQITRSIETVGSIKEYGARLDTFTNSTTQLAQAMEKIKEDDDLSENEKAVKIAALLGNASEWAPGKSSIFKEMSYASQAMRRQAGDGPKADVKARNLFELFYDYNKETSMFSGEAMDKANPAIQKRVKEYVADCNVLTEALKAHEKVASLTADEVKELRYGTQETYGKIKSDTKDIHMQMKDIIETFSGNRNSKLESARYGILDAAFDYYTKDRLTFINKNGENIDEIRFAPALYTCNSENYHGNTLREESAINEGQVKKLQQHVNGLGLTMKEYLERMGFDMKGINDSKRKLQLSTLHEEKKSYPTTVSSSEDRFYYAIDMTEKEAVETRTKYYSYFRQFKGKGESLLGKRSSESHNRDGLLVVFRSQEKIDQKIAAEEGARFWEDLQEANDINKRFLPAANVTKEKTWVDKAFRKVSDFFKNLF